MRLKNARRGIHPRREVLPTRVGALRTGSSTNWYLDIWESEQAEPTITRQMKNGINSASAVMARNSNTGRIVVCGQTAPYYSDDEGATWQTGTYTAAVGPISSPGGRVEYFQGFGFVFSNAASGSSTRVLYSKDGIRWNRLINVPNSAGYFGMTPARLCCFGANTGVFGSAVWADIAAAWEGLAATASISVAFSPLTLDYGYSGAFTFGDKQAAVGTRLVSAGNTEFTMTTDGLVANNQQSASKSTTTLRGYVWSPELQCVVIINPSDSTVRMKTFAGALNDAFEPTVSVPGNNLSFAPQAIAKSSNKYVVFGVSRIAFGVGENDVGDTKKFTFANYTNALAGNYVSAVDLN